MRKTLILLAAALSIAGPFGCSDKENVTVPLSPLPETLAVSFQDGVSPTLSYSGTRDAILKDGPSNAFRNGNFGTVPFDTLGTVALGNGLFDRRLIIKMDLSGITNCSKVLAASLSIRIMRPVSDSMSFEAHRVVRPDWNTWVEGTGGVFGGVSWTTVDGTAPWTVEGGDFDAAVLDQKTVSDDSVMTFALPPLLVRNWIKQPATNHGVIIISTGTSAHYRIAFMRESNEAAWRPRFDVTYIKGG